MLRAHPLPEKQPGQAEITGIVLSKITKILDDGMCIVIFCGVNLNRAVMKRILAYGTLALALLVLGGQPLSSAGLGLNRTVAALPARPLQPSHPTLMDRLIGKMQGIDLVFDTAVAKDQLFNYRANFECYTTTRRLNTLYENSSRDTNTIVFSNTFGFGFMRSHFLRLWAGPQISLAYEFINKNNRIYDPVLYTKFGAVVGANIHTIENMTISVEFGFRSGFGIDLTRSPDSTITRAKLEPIAALKLIFRAWDFFPSGT